MGVGVGVVFGMAAAGRRDLSGYAPSIGTGAKGGGDGSAAAAEEDEEEAFAQEQLRKAIRRQQSQMASTSAAASGRPAAVPAAVPVGAAAMQAATHTAAAAGDVTHGHACMLGTRASCCRRMLCVLWACTPVSGALRRPYT